MPFIQRPIQWHATDINSYFTPNFSQKLFSVMNAWCAAQHRAEIELFRCKMSFEDS